MKKAASILLALNLILGLFISSPVFAQNLPIKDTAITIVGEGSNIGGSQPLPDRPSKSKFFKWFDVYNCSSTSGNNYNCPEANQNRKDFVYERLADPLRSPAFRDKLTEDGKIRIYLRPPLNDGGFTGGAKYGGDILQYWGYPENASGATGKWSMIHEMGHVYELRNNNKFDDFPIASLATSNSDNDCYEKRSDGDWYFITYNNVNVPSSSGKSESFGETVGANVVCGPNDTCDKGGGGDGLGVPITNYPKKCPKTYDWIRENIYGDVDFFGLGTGGSADDSGFVFYCQGDPDWNGSGAICGADGLTHHGCLPTSIAMIFSSLGKTRTPPDIIRSLKNFGIPKNRIGCTTPGYITDFVNAGWFESEDFSVSSNLVDYNGSIGRLNLREAKKTLENGPKKYIISGASDFPCTFGGVTSRCRNPNDKIGHAFVITDVNPTDPGNPYKGTVTIRDPIGCTQNGKEINYVRERPADFVSDWNASYAIRKK